MYSDEDLNSEINLDTRTVKVDGVIVFLSTTEYKLLETLVMQKGTLISREALFERLYEGKKNRPRGKIVDVFVSRLRKKLYEASGGNNYIATKHGDGYMFNAAESCKTPSPEGVSELTRMY